MPTGGSAVEGIAIRVRGQVQGVGFRPFIWQLAQDFALKGDVLNDAEGVLIHLLQPVDAERFVQQMYERLPPLARIDDVTHTSCTLSTTPTDFKIITSQGGKVNTRIAPDTATCDDCLSELNDPTDNRYHYPFINCTHCGPRFSIIRKVPYDRPYTSMGAFPLCTSCQTEYDDPADRRFHAQPNACPTCGPQLCLIDNSGQTLAVRDDALLETVNALKAGAIVAIKGLGGYHLAVDATNAEAVAELRARKRRPAKPFALMVRDIETAKRFTQVDPLEQTVLQSGAAPIVLLERNQGSTLAPNVAPNQARIGLMLPSNPLQHLLLASFDTPLVMTSGNASGRPPCIDDDVALKELGSIADKLLIHNRDIVNRVDDSIVRVEGERPQLLRRARGYVPEPISLPKGFEQAEDLLAYGADLKNTFAFLKNGTALLSPHLGDLADPDLFSAYKYNQKHFANLFEVTPTHFACDAHPGYLSHDLAKTDSKGLAVDVGHHHAHLAACMADNELPMDHPSVLGLILDGLGWGVGDTEHEIWGGELLLGNYHECRHLTGLPPIPMPGGDLASTQPWRNLLAHLDRWSPNWHELDIDRLAALKAKPLNLIRQGISKGINCPLASSTGRLFDAAAALLTDSFDEISFEGEAAMALESLAWKAEATKDICAPEAKALSLNDIWQSLLEGVETQQPVQHLAYQFHQQLAEMLLGWIQHHSTEHNANKVVLSGGVMQNQLLQRMLCLGVERLGLTPLTHSRVPANDGGIALGQAVIAWAELQQQEQEREQKRLARRGMQ